DPDIRGIRGAHTRILLTTSAISAASGLLAVCGRRSLRELLALVLIAAMLASAFAAPTRPARAATQTFTNPAAITIPSGPGAASPYPSTINVSGFTGSVVKVTVTLNNISHTFPDDVDILLVGPTG